MKAKRIFKKLHLGFLAAGVTAALLVPTPPVAEAGIWGTVIRGAIGAVRAQGKYNGLKKEPVDEESDIIR